MRARRGTERQHAKRFEQRLRRLWLLVSRWGMIAFCVSVPLAGGAAALATLSARGVHRAATSGWHQARNDQRDGDDRSYERHRRHERRERHERHRHRGRLMNTGPPEISGSAQLGQALSASAGEWSGAPTSFSYQWLRCDEAGANCSPIESAESSSYTVADADVGATLRVQVIARNAAGPSEPARSAPTALVTNEAGHQKNTLVAASYFDQFGPSSTGEWIPWIEEHISLIRAFPPVGDWYVSNTHVPTTGSHDIYTDFTSHGTVPLDSTIRSEYVAEVERDKGLGYAGTYMDDVNFAGGNKPSPEVQSEAEYRTELANLIENVRTALGSGAVLEINTQYHDIWPLMEAHEPEVERALSQVNIVVKEFGVGPDAGITTASDYKEFTEYVDTLHEKGIHVVMGADVGTVPDEEYNLATYFLNNDGGDYINALDESPENWWPGNDVDLGSAVSGRERDSSGLWKREFTHGVVYTVEPGASSQTVTLPGGKRWFDVEHKEVTEVTLAPGTGAVLTSEG